MKNILYMGWIFIFLVGVFVTSTGQALIFECKSGAVIELIEIDAKCPDCPPHPNCPPVLACDEGYSCQKNVESPSLPSAEKQEYPPAEAEVWVQSVTGGDLIDIPLDDSRWGDREAGEVFARENANFIVWYWPNGGVATFDPTNLGSLGRWHDYRLSQPLGKPRSGTLNLSAGMRIAFNDGGNAGISVFERVGTVKPPATGKCAAFLSSYINHIQTKLPAHRIYPMGQKMMIAAWLAKSGSELQILSDAGFTTQGPVWDTGDISYLKTAKEYGLRAAHRLYTGSIAKDASLLAESLKDPVKRTAIVNRMKNEILRVVNDPVYNSVVDVWLTGTEELSARGSKLNTSGKPEANAWHSTYNELWYLDQFQKAVNQHDPQKRPLWMSDVTGTSKAQMLRTHKYLGIVGVQAYLGRSNFDAKIGHIARTVRSTGDALGIPATASLDLLYEPIPARDNPEMLKKVTEYWIYTGLNEGLQGFHLYAWHNYASMDAQTRAWMRAAYLKHVKRLTDNKLDYAYLWGDRRKDLSIDIISGPVKTNGYPSISMANIQYGEDRFVILTNSAKTPVTVEVGGFPHDCDKIFDIRTGKYISFGVSVSPTIEPLGVRLYRISK